MLKAARNKGFKVFYYLPQVTNQLHTAETRYQQAFHSMEYEDRQDKAFKGIYYKKSQIKLLNFFLHS